MHIPGGNHRFADAAAQFNDLAVDRQQISFGGDCTPAQQESIVGPGLNFEIIVKIGYPLQGFLAFAPQQSLEQLACLTSSPE